MTEIYKYSNIVESNGKTIFENNSKLQHNIPLGALVETEVGVVYANNTFLRGTVQMYVVFHGRDCDGTPLYWLSPYKEAVTEYKQGNIVSSMLYKIDGGYSEDCLTVVG